MKKHMKSADGMYHINGSKYPNLIGSRAQVWHGTAYKTSGDLTKSGLIMNKAGRIVSKNKHATAKKEKRLEKAGYKTKKGTFGSFREGGRRHRRKSVRTKKRRRRGGENWESDL